MAFVLSKKVGVFQIKYVYGNFPYSCKGIPLVFRCVGIKALFIFSTIQGGIFMSLKNKYYRLDFSKETNVLASHEGVDGERGHYMISEEDMVLDKIQNALSIAKQTFAAMHELYIHRFSYARGIIKEGELVYTWANDGNVITYIANIFDKSYENDFVCMRMLDFACDTACVFSNDLTKEQICDAITQTSTALKMWMKNRYATLFAASLIDTGFKYVNTNNPYLMENYDNPHKLSSLFLCTKGVNDADTIHPSEFAEIYFAVLGNKPKENPNDLYFQVFKHISFTHFDWVDMDIVKIFDSVLECEKA